MPIKWSAVKVSEAMDRIEARLALAQPFLKEAHDIAQEVKSIPNLPEYIDQPRRNLALRLEYTCEGLLGYVDRIRQHIPEGAIEAERKQLSYGEQQSLA